MIVSCHIPSRGRGEPQLDPYCSDGFQSVGAQSQGMESVHRNSLQWENEYQSVADDMLVEAIRDAHGRAVTVEDT